MSVARYMLYIHCTGIEIYSVQNAPSTARFGRTRYKRRDKRCKSGMATKRLDKQVIGAYIPGVQDCLVCRSHQKPDVRHLYSKAYIVDPGQWLASNRVIVARIALPSSSIPSSYSLG